MTDWWAEDAARRDAAVDVLNAAFSDRYHSLAQYVIDALPFVPEEDRALLEQVRQIAQWDHAQAERLADVIESLDGIPQVVACYPHDLAESNYCAIAYLAGSLAARLETQLAAYTRGLPSIEDCQPAHDALHDVCDGIAAQIAGLRA